MQTQGFYSKKRAGRDTEVAGAVWEIVVRSAQLMQLIATDCRLFYFLSGTREKFYFITTIYKMRRAEECVKSEF